MEDYKTYNGYIIPSINRSYTDSNNAHCHATDISTECNTVFCHECLFSPENIDHFTQWSRFNQREEKIKRILDGTV